MLSPLRVIGSSSRRGSDNLDQSAWSTTRHSSSSVRDGALRASTSARTAPYHIPQRNTARSHRSALPMTDSSDWASGSGHSTGLSNSYDLDSPFAASAYYQSTQPYEGNSVNVGGYSLQSQATSGWSGESL
ncbi:hypothetical protein CYLTODRAFT_206136 [Cylindrobasidium torrendii FP15055 ss-10]|uniref:Uncharacterized protein n=1 Tax=Cylindrobasidium torrendii FP15055 ss-10 TaxID=1314674 RepID=A0A0D7BHD1_9AGAR|nr:hypothetical protein CYLTODRAFT_206136 [Cylindrobasidium torrendii FP15055 ss-10]